LARAGRPIRWAHDGRGWVALSLGGPPPLRGKPWEAIRRPALRECEQDRGRAPAIDVRSDRATVVRAGLPPPPRRRVLAHLTPHPIEFCRQPPGALAVRARPPRHVRHRDRGFPSGVGPGRTRAVSGP